MAQKTCRYKGKTFVAGDPGHCTGVSITSQNAVPSPAPAGFVRSPTVQGNKMSDRSWFYASNGQQQGPYPEVQLRDLIARGTVRADTLVWSEGMAGWQKAGEIPGLMSGATRPPAMPQAGAPPMTGGYGGGGGVEGPLSIDLPLLPMLGRFLLLVVGYFLVIPSPWTGTAFYRWMASRVTVPGRPNFAFTGQPLDIWYVFVATG